MVDEVTISEKEHKDLMRAKKHLDALNKGGVDNWDLYYESMKKIFTQEEIEEAKEGHEKLEKEKLNEWINRLNDIISESEVYYPYGREYGAHISFNQREVEKVSEKYITDRLSREKKFSKEIDDLRNKIN